MSISFGPGAEYTGTKKILVLGEAPGLEEVRQGLPFVGPSGAILWAAFAQAGVQREEVDIVNTFWYRLTKLGTKVMDERLDEVMVNGVLTAYGRDDIQHALTLIRESQAEVIICLGGVAMHALLGFPTNEVSARRGSVYVWEGRKVVVCLHPAIVLHGQNSAENLIYTDIQKAVDELFRIGPVYKERTIHTCRGSKDLKAFLTGQDRISIDVETHNSFISCLSIARSSTEVMIVPFVYASGRSYFSEEEEFQIIEELAWVMGSPTVTKMNQNIIYDLLAMQWNWGILHGGRIEDTMYMHHLVNNGYPDNLGFIASLYSDMPYWKDEWDSFFKIKDLQVFWEYCAKDALVIWDIWESMFLAAAPEYWDTYHETVAMMPIAMMMTLYGHKVDQEALEEDRKRVEEEIKGMLAQLPEGLTETSIRSNKQLCTYFYETKGIKPYTGKTGNPTVDDNALSHLHRFHGLPEAKLIRDIRNLLTYRSKYLNMRLVNGRMYTNINLCGTRFGRWSTSEWVLLGAGSNMQNLDPRYNHFLEAD